jgi:uncharacterized protein YqeY
MTLKEQIQKDFIVAMKNKDESTKSALSGLKSKITEAEKVNGCELSDDDIIKIVNKGIKQREESATIYSEAGRSELAAKELLELNVLMDYLPVQMTDEEIEVAVREIIGLFTNITNLNALSGKTMGEFNKKHQGKADSKRVLEVIKKFIS